MNKIPNEELDLFKKICSNFKIVFDVGCRCDLDYYEIHPNCEYHLFEPNKKFIEKIKEKLKELNYPKNIKLNEYGLSDENKNGCIYFENTESFTEHWNKNIPNIDQGNRYDLKKLDDYIQNNNIENIDFLKIDVEGLDYNVILGGLNAIKSNKVKNIQIEYSGNVKQYVDLLDNFKFYWMMEPVLCAYVNSLNTQYKFSPNNVVELNDELIYFIDHVVSPSGNGGNIFGKHKL
jgi:FkbM family methyltransferase